MKLLNMWTVKRQKTDVILKKKLEANHYPDRLRSLWNEWSKVAKSEKKSSQIITTAYYKMFAQRAFMTVKQFAAEKHEQT